MKSIKEWINLVMQKDCPVCGTAISTAYPFYCNDGSRFVVCDNCGYRLELDYK
jgi:transcription elongation factor Elf1